MMAKTFASAIYALLITILSVVADPAYFIEPPTSSVAGSLAGDLIFQNNTDLNVQLYSNVSQLSITLWQQTPSNDGSSYVGQIFVTENGLGPISFNWTVNVSSSLLSTYNVFFLWVNPGQTGWFTCHYFNVTASSSQATTSSVVMSSTVSTLTTQIASASTVSSTTSALSSIVSSSASAVSSTVSSSASAVSSNGSSLTVASIGLGIGLGVGIPLVLFAGVLLGMRIVRQRREAGVAHGATRKNVTSPGSDGKYGWEHLPKYDTQHNPRQPKGHMRQEPQIFEAPGGPMSPQEVPTGGARLMK